MRPFILSLLLLLGAQASADIDFHIYIEFVEKWSNHKYNGEALPETKEVSQGYLQVLYYGDYKVAQSEYNGEVLEPINAVYDPGSNTMYFDKALGGMDTELGRIATLHETVHFMQKVSGMTDGLLDNLICTESEAYDIQLLWQQENGLRLDDIPYLKERSLHAAMLCMGNQFPPDIFPSRYEGFDPEDY